MRKTALKTLGTLLLVLAVLLAGCAAQKPQEEAQALDGNGFSASYHAAVWTRLSDAGMQVTYSHTEVDAFFALIRLDSETATAQGITQPAGMETLLQAYVANYSGSEEKITPADTDAEYVRTLTFTYQDEEMNKPYTYLAKVMVDKASGETLAVLAAYPNDSGEQVKSEISLVMDSAAITDRESGQGE